MAAGRIFLEEIVEVFVTPDVEHVPVIQPGALQGLIVDREAERLDQMEHRARHRAGGHFAFSLRDLVIVIGQLDFFAHVADNLVH